MGLCGQCNWVLDGEEERDLAVIVGSQIIRGGVQVMTIGMDMSEVNEILLWTSSCNNWVRQENWSSDVSKLDASARVQEEGKQDGFG